MGKGTTDTFPRRAACSSPGKNLLTPHYVPLKQKPVVLSVLMPYIIMSRVMWFSQWGQ